MTLLVYEKVPYSELRKQADEAIPKLLEWFKQNPKRRVCRIQFAYGKGYSIQRKDVAGQLDRIVQELADYS